MHTFSDSERKEREEKLEKRIHDFQASNFGEKFRGATLSQSSVSLPQTAQQALADWLKSRRNFLVILGAPGTGKTYLSAALMAYAFRNFNTFRYWKEEFFLNHLRKAIGEFGDYIDTLKMVLDDEFCIIDDIGSTPTNSWRAEVIFNAIDIRHSSSLPTIITSNLNEEQLIKDYHARTADRIFDGNNTVIELFNMPSLRR